MTRDDLAAASREKNVSAFLWVIRACEGTAGNNGYYMLFGGSLFPSFADHPRKLVSKSGYNSTAAGAYQILERTWDSLRQYEFPTFDPKWQDAAAVALILRRGALDDIRTGNLDAAVQKCCNEWASLPGSPYGQPTRDMAFVRKVWALHGGYLKDNGQNLAADGRPKEPTWVSSGDAGDVFSGSDSAPQQPAPKPMAPLIPALIGLLSSVAPDLLKIFSDKDKPVSERNTAAAMKVLEVAQQVANAPGPAAAVEQIAADPVKAQAFREAIVESWYELSPGDGGGVTGARQAAAAAIAQPGWAGVIAVVGQAFMDVAVVGGGGYILWTVVTHPSTSSDIRSLIIGSIAGYIAAVVQFRYGSSVSSRAKDAALIAQR